MKHLLLPCSLPLPLTIHRPSKPLLLLHARHRRCRAPNAAPPDGNSGNPSTAAPEAPSTDTRPTVTTPSSSKPTSVKNRLRSRNQARRVQDQEVYLPPVEVGVMKGKAPRASGTAAAAPRREEKPRRRKGWEEMSLAEKAVELYVGEKGALFWLNKFAYASIFIMAGAWILFRFVGPSLGLYQLDAPPLAPTDVLRGS